MRQSEGTSVDDEANTIANYDPAILAYLRTDQTNKIKYL